jgi:ribosomal protein L28
MSSSKPPQHNSKQITKEAFLPPLQKKVFLYLANNDPKTINETVKALKSHYKSTWNAFNSLEKKSLIKHVNSKSYQGQEYSRYWVTEDGAFIALCEGAKATNIIERTLKIYPENKKLHYLLESVSILGTEAFNYGYFAFVSKGKLDQDDISKMIITQSSLSPQRLIQYFELLIKYPDEKQKFDKLITEITDKLKNLDQLFKQSNAKIDEDRKNHSKKV